MQGLNQLRLDKMIKVTDDWHGCYPDNKVRISLFIQNLDKLNYHFVRICVWDIDDFGLEMDFVDTEYNNLLNKYNEWKTEIYDKATDGIDKSWFLDRGFYNA